jgi:hypothetical protein
VSVNYSAFIVDILAIFEIVLFVVLFYFYEQKRVFILTVFVLTVFILTAFALGLIPIPDFCQFFSILPYVLNVECNYLKKFVNAPYLHTFFKGVSAKIRRNSSKTGIRTGPIFYFLNKKAPRR